MKSSTYASLVTLIFLKHRGKVSKSIESVIGATDCLCAELELEDDLSHMTKYRIISELLQSKILVVRKTSKNKRLKLSKNIIEIF